MEVMKESAGHLVSLTRTVVNDSRDRERDSFFQWLNEFTSRMPRQNWRDFQRQCIQLAMHFTPPDSPQANPPRPRISQGPSALSHAQHPMDPPPRPAPTASGGYMEMLQSQPQYAGVGGGDPNQMVSNFLYYFFSRVFTVAIKLSICTPSCNVCNLSFKITKEISFLLIQR